MAANTLGKILQVTLFGESHGEAVGAVLDGMPSNFTPDLDFIQKQLDRRRPGQSAVTTARAESDQVKIISGLFEKRTTGSPLTFLIENKNQKSEDYEALRHVYRPSHADYTYEKKYGIRDHRGGGRSSARITAPLVAAGAMAQDYLRQKNINIFAYVQSIHTIECGLSYNEVDPALIDKYTVRCPDESAAKKMTDIISAAKEEGDSLGGVITCVIQNCPAGLGEPYFGKLDTDLAQAMMSINAVKGFEIGGGFAMTRMKGHESNDAFENRDGHIKTKTNYSGGIQGGISNGETIYFNVAFKPPASIRQAQDSVDQDGKEIRLSVEGRHDPCVLPRAVPIVETLAALVIGDHYLRQLIYLHS